MVTFLLLFCHFVILVWIIIIYRSFFFSIFLHCSLKMHFQGVSIDTSQQLTTAILQYHVFFLSVFLSFNFRKTGFSFILLQFLLQTVFSMSFSIYRDAEKLNNTFHFVRSSEIFVVIAKFLPHPLIFNNAYARNIKISSIEADIFRLLSNSMNILH